MKQRILYWLPVIILPASNLVLVYITDQPIQLLTIYIVGAVAEELFFRLFLLKTVFLRHMKPIPAILLVSVLFAGMHLFNLRTGQGLPMTLLQMGCGFAFGVWAGAVVWRTDKIWIPLLAHVLLNATALGNVIWADALVGAVVLIDGILLLKGEHL